MAKGESMETTRTSALSEIDNFDGLCISINTFSSRVYLSCPSLFLAPGSAICTCCSSVYLRSSGHESSIGSEVGGNEMEERMYVLLF